MASQLMKEFLDFIREKGVVGLAIGIVTGNAVTKTVGSLVENLISPLIGAITGSAGSLVDFAYTVPFTKITFKYGAAASSLIDLVIIMLVVYVIFVKSPLKMIDKKK